MARRSGYHATRAARARAAGFGSYHEVRKLGGFRALARLDPGALPERAAAKRLDALRVVRDVRAGFTPESAARYHGIDPRAVRTFTGDAIERPADRLARTIRVVGSDGPEEVTVRGSRAASRAAEHAAAVERYLRTGDASRLRQFRGQRVGGVRLETNTRRLRRLAREDALDIEELYVTGGRAA